MLDLIVRNGWIVDGTGAPGFGGGIGIRDGRIVAIEDTIGEPAAGELDAGGAVVAPGFIDGHTHYDAQILWDPLCTSSSWHGTTSVVMGNCGFTLAPCRPEDRDYLSRLLSVVEDMSLDSLREGIRWSWEDFPGYLATLERTPKAVNVGAYVGHTAVRRYVMGEDSRRAATAAEVAAMQAIVAEALRAGAIGFSTSRIPLHVDGEGQSVPSYFAELDELIAIMQAVRETGRGVIEVTSKMILPQADDEAGDLDDLVALARESGRPVTWASLRHMPLMPKRTGFILDAVAQAVARENVSLHPQIGCRAFEQFMDWTKFTPVFANLPTWRELMFLEGTEKLTALSDPAVRARMQAELDTGASIFNGWDYMLVKEARLPANQALEGQRISDIAAAQRKSGLDAFLDLAVSEDGHTEFRYLQMDTDEGPMSVMLQNPSTILTTDAGAHLTSLCNADFPTYILSHWVRKLGVLSLEAAVALLTSRPASLFGLTDRGVLEPGMAADIVIFDRDTVRGGHLSTVHDLPAGQPRLIQESEGIRAVLVNGEVVLQDGQPTGALPGQVLRSQP